MKGLWHLATGAVALIAAWGPDALGQSAPRLSYGNPDTDSSVSAPDGDASAAPGLSGYAPMGGNSTSAAADQPHKRTRIVPYLEVDQTIYDQITPQNTVTTYTTLAAGADMLINSHRTTGVATIRYEHHFSETRGVGGSDTLTGVARTTTTIVPRTLTFDFGGLATRTAINATGGTLLNPVDNSGSIYQIWSLYGGPSLTTHAGILGVKASYNLGYNEIDQIRAVAPTAGGAPVDLFGHSLTQQGTGWIGVKPGEVLPFGVALTGSYLREDTSNLDQRLIDERAGVQVTQPLSRSLALVGDVGWEKVQVAARNPVLDANGNAEVANNGQYVIDTSHPRQIAYDSDGLTWDVGVLWRPSRRTSAAAFVGRRYDSLTYYGSFYHAPDNRSTINVSVYDGIYGFGSGLMTALQGVPVDSTVSRDPFSGNVAGCFLGMTGGGCVSGALGSANALAYRAHGINAAYGVTLGRMTFNVGTGYTTRRFITATDSVLASINGTRDQTWYVNAGLSGPIDRETRFSLNGFASLYHTDEVPLGDTGDWGVSGVLSHHLTDHLVATAAVEALAVKQQIAQDQLELMGQLGLRYNFR